MLALESRFDWYTCTIPHSVSKVRSQLAAMLGPSFRWEEAKSKQKQYPQAVKVFDAEGFEQFTLMWGGKPPNIHPLLIVSSDPASTIAPLVRKLFPDHWCSRVDVCIDLCRENVIYEIIAVLEQIAAQFPRVKFDRQGPALGIHPVGGTSFYFGTKGGGVRVNVYEKAKEQFEKTGDRALLLSYGSKWVRVEVRYYCGDFDKALKLRAARLEPHEFWGASRWSQEIARRVAGLDIPAMQRRERRDDDWFRAEAWFWKQAGPTLEKIYYEICNGDAERFELYMMQRRGRPIADAG